MASVSSSLSELADSIFSYNNNIMLAALISLLLVLLFVLLLHAYAKCFFFPHRRPTRRSSVAVSAVLRPSLFDSVPPPRTKGLDPAAISAIPLFVFGSETPRAAATMECAICLSEFEDRELGRRLPKCSHGFHLECIDMWLNSHGNCPVCRAPAESGQDTDQVVTAEERNCETRSDEGHNGQSIADSSSSSSSSSSFDPPLMSLGASLKRMLSRDRSEGRIFPSSNGVELDV